MTSQNVAELGTWTDEQLRMLELVQQGFHCSEVLLFMGLDSLGKDNPDLIRSVSALAGGIGFAGEICGALTGGACVMGLYAGRGTPEEDEDPKMKMMVQELVNWFSQKYGGTYGGIRCRDITGDDPESVASRCPRLVTSVHKKVKSLLQEYQVFQEVAHQPRKPAPGVRRSCPVAAKLGA